MLLRQADPGHDQALAEFQRLAISKNFIPILSDFMESNAPNSSAYQDLVCPRSTILPRTEIYAMLIVERAPVPATHQSNSSE